MSTNVACFRVALNNKRSGLGTDEARTMEKSGHIICCSAERLLRSVPKPTEVAVSC